MDRRSKSSPRVRRHTTEGNQLQAKEGGDEQIRKQTAQTARPLLLEHQLVDLEIVHKAAKTSKEITVIEWITVKLDLCIAPCIIHLALMLECRKNN